MKNTTRLLICFAGALCYQLFFSFSTSPLYQMFGGDATFFEIIGLGITQGKVPYVDLFDHKGPLVFFINALGYLMGIGKYGVFVLQVLFMTLSFWFMRKIAGLFTGSEAKAWAAVALCIIPLFDFCVDGNHCEEWMLPFAAASLYCSVKYVLGKERKHPLGYGILYGISFGVMFYIRPTDAAMWVGSLCLGLMIFCFVKDRRDQILPAVAMFLVGFAAVSLPIWAYFYAHAAIPDFIYGTFIHNIRYASDAMFTWGGIGMVLIPAIIVTCVIILVRKTENRDIIYLLATLFGVVAILIGKRDYYHYLMPFIPVIVLCAALCLERKCRIFLWIVFALFFIFSYRGVNYMIRGIRERDRFETFYSQTDALFDMVPEAERNNIWNYNLSSFVHDNKRPHCISTIGCYLHKGITPGSRVFAYFQYDFMDPGNTIRDKEPKWVVVQPENIFFLKDMDYIEENYELVASSPEQPVCEIRLYRRK